MQIIHKFLDILKVVLALTAICFVISQGNMALYQTINPVKVDNTTVVLNTPQDFLEINHKEWKSIGYYLTSTQYKVYILNWQGFGGFVYIGREFIQDVLKAESQGKKIIFNILGGSYSMHALVPCYGSEIIRDKDVPLMYHAEGYNVWGVEYRLSKANSDLDPEMTQCQKDGILSIKDINELWQGYEIWVYKHNIQYIPDTRVLRK